MPGSGWSYSFLICKLPSPERKSTGFSERRSNDLPPHLGTLDLQETSDLPAGNQVSGVLAAGVGG